jgi:hypothetical protein
VHLSTYAELLANDDHGECTGGHDQPEEEGCGKRGRVVCRKYEVVEDEREGKVEDETRAADEGVQIPYAAEKRSTNESNGAGGDVLCAERGEPAKGNDPTSSRVKVAVPVGVRPFVMANMHAPAPYASERVPPLGTA